MRISVWGTRVKIPVIVLVTGKIVANEGFLVKRNPYNVTRKMVPFKMSAKDFIYTSAWRDRGGVLHRVLLRWSSNTPT